MLANSCIMGLKPVKLSSPTSSLSASHPSLTARFRGIACCIRIFFAGVIFTSSLQRSAGSDHAFSSNILGT
ncbi:MAG: hypothetical protein ACP5FH_12445, partial [Terracidiphilus sp.]